MLPGMSLLIIGFICFILAAVFIFLRPKPNPESGFLNSYILRWFHALAWALFGTATIYQQANAQLSLALLVIGVGAYVIFILRFLAHRRG
jgi:hypothetical protein